MLRIGAYPKRYYWIKVFAPNNRGFLKLHAIFTEIDRNIVDRSVDTNVAKQWF